MKIRVLALSFLLAMFGVPSWATRFHVADASRIVSLSDPEIAPDGRSVVLVASHADLEEDHMSTQLLLVDVQSHATRMLSVAGPCGISALVAGRQDTCLSRRRRQEASAGLVAPDVGGGRFGAVDASSGLGLAAGVASGWASAGACGRG